MSTYLGQYGESSEDYTSDEDILVDGELPVGEEAGEEEEDTEMLDNLYCVVCDKLFRTEGAKVRTFSGYHCHYLRCKVQVCNFFYGNRNQKFTFIPLPMFRVRPHKEMPPGSGSAWTDADPDPGG